MIELCAASVYPDPKLYLGFTLCMTDKYEEIPSLDLVRHCASEHGLDFDKLNDCMSATDGRAIELLRSSAIRSRDAGVVYSCTVRLEEQIRCVRDGGQWKDCPGGSKVSDLVAEIKQLHQKKTGSS